MPEPSLPAVMGELRRLDQSVQALTKQVTQLTAAVKRGGRGGQPAERPNPALVELPPCTCVSGWVMDEDGSVTRCPCSTKEGS